MAAGFLKASGVAALAAMACAAGPADRNAAWREDIEVARTQFLARDLSYSARARETADRRLRALAERAPRLNDARIVAELAAVAALADNAHTRAYILRNRGVWRRYPIRIWNFSGEWRVVATRPAFAHLLGARVTHVGGAPVARAEARVRPLFAGNANWARYMAGYSLTSPDALIGAGVIARDDAPFAFEIAGGHRLRTRLALDAFVRRETPEENWWFLSPAHPATAGWRQVLADTPLPPVLEGAAVNYRLLRCADGLAYVQFNRSSNAAQGESTSAFGQRVLADLAADPPTRLLVDLRFNTGGDLSLGWSFFKNLAASQSAQHRETTAVLVGPNTFSAGITHVAQMRTLSRAVLVGTEPGDELETWAEGGNVLLPNARINMHYADRAHTYSIAPSGIAGDLVHLDLDVETLAPDVAVDWTWESYLAGRDPYVEAALGRPMSCPS